MGINVGQTLLQGLFRFCPSPPCLSLTVHGLHTYACYIHFFGYVIKRMIREKWKSWSNKNSQENKFILFLTRTRLNLLTCKFTAEENRCKDSLLTAENNSWRSPSFNYVPDTVPDVPLRSAPEFWPAPHRWAVSLPRRTGGQTQQHGCPLTPPDA